MEGKENLTFEEALKRLEAIVAMLNSGNAPLDRSLAMFEEGTALVRFCTGRLDEAEKKVKILTNLDGTPEEADFDPKKG